MQKKIKESATQKRKNRLVDWDDLTLIEFQDEEFVKAYINEIFSPSIRNTKDDPIGDVELIIHALEKLCDAHKYKLWKLKANVFKKLEKKKVIDIKFKDMQFTVGSENVFKDLGLPDADKDVKDGKNVKKARRRT